MIEQIIAIGQQGSKQKTLDTMLPPKGGRVRTSKEAVHPGSQPNGPPSASKKPSLEETTRGKGIALRRLPATIAKAVLENVYTTEDTEATQASAPKGKATTTEASTRPREPTVKLSLHISYIIFLLAIVK